MVLTRTFRPRDPVRKHFEHAEKGASKVDRVQCRYCKKSFSAVNPKRLQGHMAKCVAFQRRSQSSTPESEDGPESESESGARADLQPESGARADLQPESELECDVSNIAAVPALPATRSLHTSVKVASSSSSAVLPKVVLQREPARANSRLTPSAPVSAFPEQPRIIPLHSPRYEKVVLEANAIFVQLHGYVLPSELAQINATILSRTRSSSPPLHTSEAQQMAFRVANSLSTTDMTSFLFPPNMAPNCARAERMPFAEEAIPQGVPWDDGVSGQKLSTPIPDLTFGYREDEDFETMRTQCATFNRVDLVGVCSPIPGLYRPFLTFELKSDVHPMLSARNATAGAGAACVYFAQTMSMLVPGLQFNRRIAMAFSCTVVGFSAVLWIHWMEPRRAINMAAVETYNLCKGEELVKLKQHVASILEWGLTDRWTMQREHLKAIHSAMRRDFQDSKT